MKWPFRRRQQPTALISVSDPAFAAHFGIGSLNFSGVEVGETSALGLSAVWRAVSLISETIASLTLRTVQESSDGRTDRVSSFLDDPGSPDGLTPFNFWETVLCHLLLHGNAYLLHRLNGGGGIAGLLPVHPLAVSVTLVPAAPGGKLFTFHLPDGTNGRVDSTAMTHIMGKSLDGFRGLSPISIARNSLGTAIAGDRAAARMFNSGALMAGLVTPDEDVSEDDGKAIKASLDRDVSGWDNAGQLAFVNRKLKFTPWTMSLEDAQFLQSRQFQVEEVCRWFGLPSFTLNLEQKSTSWGTGIESMQRGLARQVLGPWTRRIEQPVSRLLRTGRRAEFDFSTLERPTPEVELDSLLKQVAAGVLTRDEFRATRNLPPLGPAETPPEPPADEGVSG